jgi:hypothetical protein
MLATFVPDALTPLQLGELVEPMRWALESRMTGRVGDDVLALALAKCALETGRFQKVHNWNFGNIKCPATRAGMYTAFACGENLWSAEHGDEEWWFTPAGVETCRAGKRRGLVRQPTVYTGPPWHPQTRFCAWANRFDGADAYVDFIARRPAMWAALLEGHPSAFVAALKRGRYFTAPEEPYRKAVNSLVGTFQAVIKAAPRVEVPEIDYDAIRSLVISQHYDEIDPFERPTPPEAA